MDITQVSESEDTVSHYSLPVLFVSDLVVLPGMVVSIELDESSRAAVDAARASSEAGSSWPPGSRTATRRTA